MRLRRVAVSQVDLPYVSIPRVQAPALTPLATAAGFGMERIAVVRRSFLWLTLVVVAASMLFTIFTLSPEPAFMTYSPARSAHPDQMIAPSLVTGW